MIETAIAVVLAFLLALLADSYVGASKLLA